MYLVSLVVTSQGIHHQVYAEAKGQLPLPGTAGLRADDYERVLGARATRDLKVDEPVAGEDVKS